MNTSILIKCVDELKKDTPNLQYVLGMLETIIELSGSQMPITTPLASPNLFPVPPYTITANETKEEPNPLTEVGTLS